MISCILFFRFTHTIGKVINIIVGELEEITFFSVNIAQNGKVNKEAERFIPTFQFTYLYIFEYIRVDRKIIQSFFYRS